nr:hypothetical protein [Candidatus Sigynarchaeota archaeon]
PFLGTARGPANILAGVVVQSPRAQFRLGVRTAEMATLGRGSARGDASWIFRLEPCAWKHACTVPRGGWACKSPDLPGEFKIVNPKTGKGMPGHVTKEGFKIGDGNCPYWNNLQKLNAAKAEKRAQAVRQPPAPAGSTMQNAVSSMARGQATQQTIPAPGFVIVTVDTMRIELARSEAVRIAKEIIEQLE